MCSKRVAQIVLKMFIWCCLSRMPMLSPHISWWRHQMKTVSALLALCEGNPPVTGRFASQRVSNAGFDVFFVAGLNERLNKQLSRRWFKTPGCSFWHHSNMVTLVHVMARCLSNIAFSSCRFQGIWLSVILMKIRIIWYKKYMLIFLKFLAMLTKPRNSHVTVAQVPTCSKFTAVNLANYSKIVSVLYQLWCKIYFCD